MAMYYNPAKPNSLKIKDFGLPQFANQYLQFLLIEKNMAPGTIFNYAVSLRTFLRWVKSMELDQNASKEFTELPVNEMTVHDIANLGTSDIYDFMAYCSTERSCGAKSRASKLAAIRSLYGFLRKRDKSGYITHNPVTDISSPKRERSLPIFLTTQESKELLDTVGGEFISRDYCILVFFLNCGMRLSELVAINLSDIKDDTLRLHGKGRKERIVHLNKQCLLALEDYLVVRSEYAEKHEIADENALFLAMHSKKGRRITARRVEQIVERDIKRAGLQGNKFSPHKLRHTAATIMYRDAGAGVLEIQEILGHENVQTTTIYTHTSGELVKKALDNIGVILANDE